MQIQAKKEKEKKKRQPEIHNQSMVNNDKHLRFSRNMRYKQEKRGPRKWHDFMVALK
jgi:hypothetical protein